MKNVGLVFGSFCVLALSAGQANAQGGTVSPPPENFVTSAGGVDMRSGRYAYDATDLSIGGVPLTLARTLAQQVVGHTNPFANFSSNMDVLLSEKRINVFGNIFSHTPGQPDYQIEVSFGGKSESFRAEGGGSFSQVSRSGYAQLTVSGDRSTSAAVYTMRLGDGTEAVFRQIGSGDCSTALRCAYVSTLTSADGTKLSFEYDNAGSGQAHLRSVVSNRGYALIMEYSGGFVVKACVLNLTMATKPASNICPSGVLTSSYTYSTAAGVARLATATGPDGAVESFVNTPTTIGFVRPGESVPWLTNTIMRRMNDDGLYEDIVTAQSFADGRSFAYNYDSSPAVPGHTPSLAGGFYTDNAGRQTTVRYGFPITPRNPSTGHGGVSEGDPEDPADLDVAQITPGPVEITDPLGRTTTVDYCDPGPMANLPASWMNRCYVLPAPTSNTTPDGIKVKMTWDLALRNLLRTQQVAIPGSGDADIVKSAAYNTCSLTDFRACSKPVTITDARGQVTNISYKPENGQVLTESLPADPGGIRPVKRYEYVQRYAWVSNGGGGYVQAASPVWLLSAMRTCRTTATLGSGCAGGSSDEVVTAYDYGPDSGPNNLVLRGQTVTADNTTLRTCFGYDQFGNKISETSPRANLGGCQ